jgi:ABC-type nitrate/sulfonate/bicarbonate transport system substrate-binding protein
MSGADSKLRSRLCALWIALPFIAALLVIGCSKPPGGSPNSRSKVSIGIQVSPAMILLMVAKEKGFFEQQGLDVELKQFTAGKFALQAFFGGSVDYAVSGEVPVCLAVLQGNQARVVAQVVERTIDEVRIVVRNDDGKTTPADPGAYFRQKKRRVATSFGGGPEFFTYNFLQHYKIAPNQVEILSQRPEDMPASLASKSVDAVSIFDPFAFIAERQLGRDAVTFRASDLYSELYVLAAHPKQTDQDGATITAILRALQQAQRFTAEHPEEAKQILQMYTKLDSDIVNGIWGNFSFKIALTKDLLSDWNAEAKWAKETGKVTPQTQVPDFTKFVDSSFLEKIDPGSVRLQ